MKKDDKYFKVKAITEIDKIEIGNRIEISDYVISNENKFIQLQYNQENNDFSVDVKPGIFTVKDTATGLQLFETSFNNDCLLESFINTKVITDKVDCFFRNLDKYAKYGIEVPKRAMLLHGPAGTGKTSSIASVVKKYVSDGKTAVVIWKTDVVHPDEIKHFITHFNYIGVDKLFFIAEDLGGVEIEDRVIPSSSSLLSILDNQEKTFKIPTLIFATTNFPQMFLANIANRPQRFDDKIEIGYPNATARRELLKFISQNEASDEALNEIEHKRYEGFTPAHIREAVIRSAIYEITLMDSFKNMLSDIESYNKSFSKAKSIGIGND